MSEKKKELIYSLLQNYVLSKKSNQVYMRENNQSYTYSKGVLVGALMALEYDLHESDNYLYILSQKTGKTIMVFDKNNF